MKKTITRSGKLNIATISDVHIFHARVLTTYIIETLQRLFKDDDETGELDYIIIAGDLFDRIRTLADDEVWDVMLFFSGFLEMCNRRNIRVRILEGTPSHDRNQSNLVKMINMIKNEDGADVRYIETLMIDYEEEFDFHMLYIPDEWHHDHNEIFRQVQEQLRLAGIDQVQIAVMHGMFEHQVPFGVKVDTHKASNYLPIVEWFITIGHVHTMSIMDRIYAQGSPERLTHNEEGPKGMFKFCVDLDKRDFTARFIENKKATPFVTLDLREETFESAREVVKTALEEIPRGFVRLHLSSELFGEGILDALMSLTDKDITWAKKVDKQEKEEDTIDEMKNDIINLPKINDRTIVDLFREEAWTRTQDQSLLDEASDILRGVINE